MMRAIGEWARAVAVIAAAGVLLAGTTARAQPPDLLVFAAASLETALGDLSAPVERAAGVHLRVSYAATSTLAKQIVAGAPAALFISADLQWMNYVAERGFVRAGTRVNLLGNRLVLIAPARSPATLAIAPRFPLAAALGGGRLAVADPTGVPAGIYAREALTSLGVWSSVQSHLAPAENVRAALLLVSRGEAPLGIVYRTDALADRGVAIVGTFPENTHPPVVYPAAVLKDAPPEAAKVLAFLRSPAARVVFEREGFTSP